jgi:hypothetical protein
MMSFSNTSPVRRKLLVRGLILVSVGALVLALAIPTCAEDFIVFTANQDFLSRIYFLHMDGSVDRYFEYDFYRFVDMEVVNNDLYVAEAFAPRMYRVDPTSGDLDLIIDDWSLYYFYGLCYDGRYFYVDEWDMNRYDIDGVKDGVASFDEYVLGCAWDGSHMFTLDDTNLIKCWDTWGWPTITAVPEFNFTPPSAECRGLWFDGEYFWSAESKDGVLGYIYRFDHDGQVVNQWLEPAYVGWGACVIDIPVTYVESERSSEREGTILALSIPTPVNSRSVIEFSLPRDSRATLRIYNTLGQVVGTLASGTLQAGRHQVGWKAPDLASGVYFCRLEADGRVATKKIVLVE